MNPPDLVRAALPYLVFLITLFLPATLLAAPHGVMDRDSMGSGKPAVYGHKLHYRGPAMPNIPHRRGLAVIADFVDSRLEDWQGPGINSVAQLQQQLQKMQDHWAWLSHGKETITWDIIRITLPVPLSADAYSWWGAYRDAVGELIRQQVDVSRYDLNHDGVIDSAWIIASSKGQDYDYMIGGASRNAGVNIFVDVQDSLSLIVGATGNFNHELGHTVGLPDIYGTDDTLHYLTLMSDSWALPPQDFTAYERTLLGWDKPKVLPPGQHHVHLRPADSSFDAVRVSTGESGEYFLIEYRHRPDSGFGSSAPPYNGLAVYHVLEGSDDNQDPPLLKLEPADGQIAPNAQPELNDFLFPDNIAMLKPLVLTSYFGNEPVFQIQNVQWAHDGGLDFDVSVNRAASTPAGNLLGNSSFEMGSGGAPLDWLADAWVGGSLFTWNRGHTHSGHYSAGINSPIPNDARWIQAVGGLVPGNKYQLCGWLRGRNIVTDASASTGANVSVLGGFVSSPSLSGNFDWTQECVVYAAESDSNEVACRLGFYGSTVTGTVECDDMSLVPVRSAFP